MILDYFYSEKTHQLSISYVNETGNKDILKFDNLLRFKTYKYLDDTSKASEDKIYTNWNGKPCVQAYTNKPTKIDLRNYILDLDERYQKVINGKVFPRLYTFDIETEISDEFPNPEYATQPITTISVCSPELNTIVFGTRKLNDEELEYCKKSFENYLNNTDYFKFLNIKMPTFSYVYFKTEKEMLETFLTKIVAAVPVLAGWNSLGFDWQYICNRINNFYPTISLTSASKVNNTYYKRYNTNTQHIGLKMPVHTVLLDMMDVVSRDKVVLPIKESMSLDYIAHASLGINKIQYEGTLQDLFLRDYKKYVYYNAIDSILVQLINYKFKGIQIYSMYSLYCTEKLESCFSTIALTESLFIKKYRELGLKIVNEEKDEDVEQPPLIGAYVKEPRPGKYSLLCCNDFSSLYPSTIITCNMSFENYIHTFDLEDKIQLEKFEEYKINPEYFCSVNGSVYKNDKDYAFKLIQKELKATRAVSKYLSKKLDAQVISDIDHILKDINTDLHTYDEQIIETLKLLGVNDVVCGNDFKKYDKDFLKTFRSNLMAEIVFHSCKEQAMKLLGNGAYGGVSHPAFFWNNMNIANDITGESRNLTHLMEDHLSTFWYHNWKDMKDLHKQLGIEVDESLCEKYLKDCNSVIYGDTDSLYIEYESLLNTIKGVKDWSLHKKLEFILKLNTDFLNEHNREYIYNYYKGRNANSIHEFELETIAKSAIFLNVKKHYAQILLWKDGKFYDENDLPMKIKGLEIVQSSTPQLARKQLSELLTFLLNSNNDQYLLQKLNQMMQQKKADFYNADIEDISGSVKVNNYNKYIISDNSSVLMIEKKTPFNVKALGAYNWIVNNYRLNNENIYGGKLKYYQTTHPDDSMLAYFAFQSKNLPKWSQQYAPISHKKMFIRFVLEPFNRILSGIGMKKLEFDGIIQLNLGDLFEF